MGWGAIRTAVQWRRRGEAHTTAQPHHPHGHGQAYGSYEQSQYQQSLMPKRPSFSTALLRAATNNAIGAAIFSAGWGVHGLRYEAWKQWNWTQASGGDAWHVTIGGMRALFDVSCLGVVLRLAPFSLGPAVLVTLLY
mmetsp:Transcript_18660/g.43469  ORF Transcript_18660/g.43469 Transcript_18660/m.43469 type:complete len:137 (+) Transcript_18660:132-542(+)